MTDKTRKVSSLLQTLSRLPGLGFLSNTDRQMREAADSVRNVENSVADRKRQMRDVRTAAGDLAASDDDEE
jgi:hypothetical protein